MKRKNAVRKVFKVLLNPCSPIMTLIVGWLLTLLATSIPEKSDLNLFVQALIKNKNYILIILACWLFSTIIYTHQEEELEEKSKEIILLNKEVEHKQSQLDQSNGVILSRYGEFARFNRNNRFREVLESFVNNNEGVDSAQIYKYSSKYLKRYIQIKVSYQEGYAYEGVDINNILQTYYNIKKSDYKQFKEILDMWKRYLINYNIFCKTERECLEENLLKKINDLLIKYHKELNSLNTIKQVKDIHFDKYRIVLLLVRMLSDNNDITKVENILANQEVEEHLNNAKRTGILGSILLEDTYIFKHRRMNSKNGRIYICFYVEIYKENYIVLFACPPSELDLLNEDEEWKWNLRYESLKNDLIQRLKDTSINQQGN